MERERHGGLESVLRLNAAQRFCLGLDTKLNQKATALSKMGHKDLFLSLGSKCVNLPRDLPTSSGHRQGHMQGLVIPCGFLRCCGENWNPHVPCAPAVLAALCLSGELDTQHLRAG